MQSGGKFHPKIVDMRKSDWIGLVLLGLVIGCRFWTPMADFYAKWCYPVISGGLSLLASIVPVSLEEVVAGGFMLAFLVVLFSALFGKKGFFNWLGRTARVTMWLVVWFYAGWGINYFRTPLYPRAGIEKVTYEDEAFSRFLTDYTKALDEAAETTAITDRAALEADIKAFYADAATGYGYARLRDWQHVKEPLANGLYSGVGVLGFMGPFLCESQVNLDLPETEYPFTVAHELAHLAGVTSEAEANYWAYAYCRQSSDPAARYSGYLSLLPYVATSAHTLLSEDRYARWYSDVPRRAKDDYEANRSLWESKRIRIIDGIQQWLMDRFLKTNGVGEGARDYYGVIGMIMTMDTYEGLRDAIAGQLERYPESRVQDIYKDFFQDALGPGHLIEDRASAEAYLLQELSVYKADIDSARYAVPQQRICPVGDVGNYVRVDLSVVLDSLVSTETLLNALVTSANTGPTLTPEAWAEKWGRIACILRRDYPGIPDAGSDLARIDSLLTTGNYALHHSPAFNAAYHPHYRIIDRRIYDRTIAPVFRLAL